MEDRIKSSFIYSFVSHGEYLKDLLIINTKCLIDDNTKKVSYIDYNRLNEELLFYKYYGIKNNNSPYNINFILPIILSNSNIKKSEDEILKNIDYYCKYNKEDNRKYEYTLVGVVYNYLIQNLIKNSNLSFIDILETMKKYIIEFKLEDIEKKDIVNFERKRIYFIQKIDKLLSEDLDSIKEENIIDGFLRILYQIYLKDYEEENEELKSIKNSILGILGFKFENNIDIKNMDFISSLGSYILKIRKYEINKKVYIENSHPKELINLNVGDVVYNPILNNIKVTDKKIEDNVLYIKVRSKSGEYIFKFKRA